MERAANPADARAVRLGITSRGAEVSTAARAALLELEERRLAPPGGRQSQQSAELRDTLLGLLRHAQASGGAGDDPPPAVR